MNRVGVIAATSVVAAAAATTGLWFALVGRDHQYAREDGQPVTAVVNDYFNVVADEVKGGQPLDRKEQMTAILVAATDCVRPEMAPELTITPPTLSTTVTTPEFCAAIRDNPLGFEWSAGGHVYQGGKSSGEEQAEWLEEQR